MFLCSVIALLVVIGGVLYFGKFHVYSNYYAQYEIKNGEIVGVESAKLSREECKHTPLFYCLKHKGWFTHVSEIDVKSSNEKLPASPRVRIFEIGESEPSNEKGALFDGLLSAVSKIRISEDENERIIKEEYVDESNHVLFELNYSYINGKDAWAHFVSGDGQGLVVRDSGVEQARLSWNEDGRLVGVTYYDHNGVCKEIAKGINGYLWDLRHDGVTCRYTLNEYSQPSNSSEEEYNVVYTKEADDSLQTWYGHAMSVNTTAEKENSGATLANGPLGFAKMVKKGGKTWLYDKSGAAPAAELLVTYDEKGNVLKQEIKGRKPANYPSLYEYKYDRSGYLISKTLCNSQGKPFGKNPNAIYRWSWTYDANGSLVHEERTMVSGKVAYSKTLTRNQNCLVEETEDISKAIPYVKKVEVTVGKRQTVSYYGRNNMKLNGKWCKNSKETDSLLVFHKMVRSVSNNVVTEEYYRFDEQTASVVPLQPNAQGSVYFKKVTTLDNDGIATKYRTYDAQGNILKSMMYFTQNGKIIGRAVCGVDDKPVRCGKWEAEGFCYYRIYINTNNDNDYANILSVNEWGEKGVLYDSNEQKYYETEYLNCKGLSFKYHHDEYQISGTYSQINFVKPKDLSGYTVPYLHILNKRSTLYQMGFRDGDRIVACGPWRFGMGSHLLSKCWNLDGQDLSIRMLRVSGNGYVAIEKVIPAVKQLRTYSEYHELLLTNQEYQLLKSNL